VSHLNFVIAHSFNLFGTILACVICELFIAISVMKILLVKRFQWIFPHDPYQMSKVILVVAIIVAFFPCVVAGTYETLHWNVMTQTVAYTSGMTYSHQGISFLQKFLMFWILLTILTLILTLLYIPYQLKKQGLSQAIQAGESNAQRKEVNLKRILLGSFGALCHIIIAVISNFTGQNKGLPILFYSSTISLNITLIYFIAEDNVLKFLKTKLLQKLHMFCAFIRTSKVTPNTHTITG
jgi:hypothetical protein